MDKSSKIVALLAIAAFAAAMSPAFLLPLLSREQLSEWGIVVIAILLGSGVISLCLIAICFIYIRKVIKRGGIKVDD